MKQLGIVFRFEYIGYIKRKSFLALTIVLMLAAAVALTWPRLAAALFSGDGGDAAEGEPQRVAVVGVDDPLALEAYTEAFGAQQITFVPVEQSREQLEAAVESGEYDFALLQSGPLSYTRIVKNLGMTDSFDYTFEAVLLEQYQSRTLAGYGMDEAQIRELLGAQVEADVVTVSSGKDQLSNFFYTYVLIFLLYFAIIMYGQFVASSVATEKSTRAMELLITSAQPNSLMFGKVLGAGMAGLTQLALILGTSYLFYNLNAEYYADSMVVQSIFAMPFYMLVYTLVFFVLGFFIYAFIYAALASLVSRMEDLSTAISPVTYLFIIAFVVVMMSMASGSVDSPVMAFCSYFPLTSPMAMFARIAMGDVAGWKIAVSVVLLVASTVGIGIFSATLYRLGVLLYGNAPKPKEIIRMLRAQKQAKA